MNKPEEHILNILDCMTCSDISFAIYRMPWTDTPIFVMQKGNDKNTFSSPEELNGKKGFVISPFHFTENHPGVLINPDVTATGWEEISDVISGIGVGETISGERKESYNLPSETELKQDYIEVFSRFISPLKNKTFRKLVLSRCAEYALRTDFSPVEAFVTACNNYPRMMISLSHTPVSGTWIGCTPEIILSGEGEKWNTVALAGTMPIKGDEMNVEWHKKEKDEQAFVSEYIHKVLKKFSNKITVKGPYTARAGQLLHLKTDFCFEMKDTSMLGSLLDTLHPTPAVCGLPKENAYDFIIENEGYDRKYYSGIIGWLDPDGHTNLYVNLRCLNITESIATLYAGGGLLSSSEANSEWEETQYKMNTIKLVVSC